MSNYSLCLFYYLLRFIPLSKHFLLHYYFFYFSSFQYKIKSYQYSNFYYASPSRITELTQTPHHPSITQKIFPQKPTTTVITSSPPFYSSGHHLAIASTIWK